MKNKKISQIKEHKNQYTLQSSRPVSPFSNPTTSFSTTTTKIYAIGAGITAAAGTRLALQLFLVKAFTLFSFQLQDYNSPALLFIVTTSSI